MFGHESQAQSRAVIAGTSTGATAASKAFEYESTLMMWHPRSVIFHSDMRDLAASGGNLHPNLGCATTVQTCIVDEVGDHASQSSAVGNDQHVVGPVANDDGRVRHARHRHGMTDELGEEQFVGVQRHGPGIEARDLQ